MNGVDHSSTAMNGTSRPIAAGKRSSSINFDICTSPDAASVLLEKELADITFEDQASRKVSSCHDHISKDSVRCVVIVYDASPAS